MNKEKGPIPKQLNRESARAREETRTSNRARATTRGKKREWKREISARLTITSSTGWIRRTSFVLDSLSCFAASFSDTQTANRVAFWA